MRRLLLAAALAWPAAAGQAADIALSLSGRLAHPRSFSAAELAALPQAALPAPASDLAAPGPHWTAVLLWPLLDQAGWVDQPGRKTHLQHVILARGRDGYTVALSIGELDPAFEGKQVLIATGRDGKALGSLDLVVPGDRRHARWVHDLQAIEVQ